MLRRLVHSIVVANYNSIATVNRWLDSLTGKLDPDDEVIIVDGDSDDGSGEVLKDASQRFGFTFTSQRSNVGQARQLGYRMSTGEYVIGHLDTDDIVIDLRALKRLYHDVLENDPQTGGRRAFWCWGFFIIPRTLADQVGGWPPLHYYEDRLLASRLADIGSVTVSSKVTAVAKGIDPKKRKALFRTWYSFRRVRDGLRLGFFEARNPQGLLLLPPAWLASRFMPRFRFDKEWEQKDVNRDHIIVPWVKANGLGHLLVPEERPRQ